MTQVELLEILEEEFPHLTRNDLRRFLGSFFDSIVHGLESGCKVCVHPFGVFGISALPAREVFHPGEKRRKWVEAGHFPQFATHYALFSRINPHRTTMWEHNLKRMKNPPRTT